MIITMLYIFLAMPNRSLPSAIKVQPGVSIYRVGGSEYWYMRAWDSERQSYHVKATGETSPIKAKRIARDHAVSLLKAEKSVDREFTFRHFAIKCLTKNSALAANGERNSNYARTIKWAIENQLFGLMKRFGPKDIREINTPDFQNYMNNLAQKHSELSSSTKGHILAAFRNVLKIARDEGVIHRLPDTPRAKQRDNPRPFFAFHPLVAKKDDAYKKLLDSAKAMAKEDIVIRGVPVTDELYDIILFLTHSFVRPTVSELYAIRHSDITEAANPKRLLVTIRRGKTGFRTSITMPAAVSVYRRIRQRYPDAKPDDSVFLPQYQNRQTAAKIVQRQFRALLARAGLELDPKTGRAHTIYSLRHTAICMRIILSHGKVN